MQERTYSLVLRTFTMTLLQILAIIFYFAKQSSFSAIDSNMTWHSSEIPVFLPQEILKLDKPRFSAKAVPDLTTHCNEECLWKEAHPTLKDLKENLSYETVYTNGTRTLTMVDFAGFDPSTFLLKQYTPRRLRRKRQIFGVDGRFDISGKQFLLHFPFSTTVKISTGCTGVLVSDRHVLTAAHCIHDGKDYVKGAKKLKVGFLQENPKTQKLAKSSKLPPKLLTRWSRVKRTQVPKGWIRSQNDLSMDYDYALLELKRPHDRPHMEITVMPTTDQVAGNRIHFSGFDSDRPGQLVYRFCRIINETPHLIYQHCDAQPGSSGSGVYAKLWLPEKQHWERKIVGIFSGHQWVDLNGVQRDYNVAVRITPLKYAQICYWIKGAYSDCHLH
ncbi:hypothetical protein chiPu_0007965 [Chiloscyllium punctatum]|uniref:Peptidase S1 domain-containing protein n=2 Tax=Chiloscyllium punctatum TaxID=137246 RepID=A0A401SGQ4_CHIPU|nr:hypothetical protein [Chiloscyllium punctatum]